jgi:hypothetical protein
VLTRNTKTLGTRHTTQPTNATTMSTTIQGSSACVRGSTSSRTSASARVAAICKPPSSSPLTPSRARETPCREAKYTFPMIQVAAPGMYRPIHDFAYTAVSATPLPSSPVAPSLRSR